MCRTFIRVPRELLERIVQRFSAYQHRNSINQVEAIEELRALLTAQPQASDEFPFAGFDPKFCPGSNPDNPQTEEYDPQASAAQSAGVSEGWKLVPAVITDAMADAAGDEGTPTLPPHAQSQLRWSAMLAAAPAQPAAQDQGEVQRLLKDYRALLVARRFPDNDEGDFGARIRDQELRRIDAALTASTGQEV